MPRKKILPILVFFLVLSGNLSAKDSEEAKKAAELNELGINALKKSEYIKAIEYFQNAAGILPDNKIIKKNLAISYNNYGILLQENNKSEEAIEYINKAIELEKDNIDYKRNLVNVISNIATKYYQNGDYDSALKRLEEALAIMPDHVSSLILLGQIYYQTQELSKAQEIWEKAYRHDPHNDDLRQMLLRLKEEKPVETSLKQLDADFFDIRFDKKAVDSEIYNIRDYLREAYREVGRDFNYYLNHKIPVILYTQKDFKKLRQTPEWVAGIYDGKIRLPIKNNGLSQIELKKLIFHEFTHAVVFYLTDGRCPIWLNEGLAKYEEFKTEKPDLAPLRKAVKEDSLISLSKLGDSFSLHGNTEKLNLAYLESYSFVEFMLYRWNFYVIKGILEQLKDGKTVKDAFNKETSRSLERIEKDWKEYLVNKFS